jgi:hypothetical protein
MRARISLALLFLLFTACDGSTGPRGGGKLSVRFGTASSTSISAAVLSAGPSLTPVSTSASSADELTLTGSNGTLVIQDIRFIVTDLKLHSVEGTGCDDNDDEVENGNGQNDDDDVENENDEDDEGDCEDFEGGPFIVDLPLDGNVAITTQNLAAGTYDRFKFHIEDLEEDDDDDDGERIGVANVLTQMRTVYPNFPNRASMVVKGTFNGTPFTTYFRAEHQAKFDLNPPVTVPGATAIMVTLDPSKWFRVGDTVLNLADLDGRLVEFHGFLGGVKGVHREDD